jgi:hypothetical protein
LRGQDLHVAREHHQVDAEIAHQLQDPRFLIGPVRVGHGEVGMPLHSTNERMSS